MFRLLLVFLSFSFININAKDKKIINIRECNYYRLGKNVDKKEVKKFYLKFAKTVLTRNSELIADLFDERFYSVAYPIAGKEFIDSEELVFYFKKFQKIETRQLIQLLDNKNLDHNEKFFVGLYLKFFSSYPWNCLPFDMKFKSIYHSIKNKVNCGIEVDRGDPQGYRYLLKVSYRKDIYDISVTKDLKIKNIQCTALFYEGY
ncbi:MAG TPA: hypothetical protein PLX69_16555 [Leptospiraceae bacterium]|nr:hypothetical protein [Leptospiraceae bacterium]HRG76173.1 hypothetical protein [Leptospiraceae bacterium]